MQGQGKKYLCFNYYFCGETNRVGRQVGKLLFFTYVIVVTQGSDFNSACPKKAIQTLVQSLKIGSVGLSETQVLFVWPNGKIQFIIVPLPGFPHQLINIVLFYSYTVFKCLICVNMLIFFDFFYSAVDTMQVTQSITPYFTLKQSFLSLSYVL